MSDELIQVLERLRDSATVKVVVIQGADPHPLVSAPNFLAAAFILAQRSRYPAEPLPDKSIASSATYRSGAFGIDAKRNRANH